jgi:UDP-glucose 4-epimerase
MAQKLILVTGGAGLVGSNLCRRLVEEGHKVISLDNYFAGSRDAHVAGAEYREGHTKDIARHVPETPDVVFHLGEYARVEQSLLEPELVYDLNVLGTKGVVEFWKAKQCKLVYAGSSTKFGDGGAAREATPYASSKAANTELVKKIGDELHLPYAITYFYNVYGPGERAGIYGTVVEAFKQMYLHGEPLAVTSPGTQKRNFTHVEDIVDALMLVAEKGQGDEYGLGNERSYSILELARLFGTEIVMLPPRAGSRTQSSLDTRKVNGLGWRAKRDLSGYVSNFLRDHSRGKTREKRVLVFSTTFFPVQGPAEETLIKLMRQMPDVQFDIVTAAFSPEAKRAASPLPNARIYRVGSGRPSDKYLLPILGSRVALKLYRTHRYLFAWSIMASYAAFAGMLVRRRTRLPLLITLADQDLDSVSSLMRMPLRLVLTDADQVYGPVSQEKTAAAISSRRTLHRSIGEGDAFANQLRYSYAELLRLRGMS